jgi:hypothetical protein
MIPFGQPILVGHHSEGRARRDQGRIESGMRAGVESQQPPSQQGGWITAPARYPHLQ